MMLRIQGSSMTLQEITHIYLKQLGLIKVSGFRMTGSGPLFGGVKHESQNL
ncbi:hypothetical protein GCM10025859_26040 [Alicyclobacillus fastidiosus]|nr:hypothetical protein GCM10025859_26040 [Alicyclobacillus fastidiosus]